MYLKVGELLGPPNEVFFFFKMYFVKKEEASEQIEKRLFLNNYKTSLRSRSWNVGFF